MKYEIIFYRSGKTAGLQNDLDSALSPASLELDNACAAISPKELSEELSAALKRTKLVFIIGGFDDSSESTDMILKKILRSRNGSIQTKSFFNGSSNCSAKTIGQQTIILLSDDIVFTEEFRNKLSVFLAEQYDLNIRNESSVSTDDTVKELDREMSSINRVKVASKGSTAEKRNKKKLNALKICIFILLLLAAAQLSAAAYLYFTQM